MIEKIAGVIFVDGWGATSDSVYVEKTGILNMQQEAFAKEDLVDEKYIAFTNILDKGYRIICLVS